MVEKTVSSRFKIVGRSMKCKGGHSVVEQSAYISRTTMKSEYDGRTYYPKYSEDLVHVEISLPEGAPEQYKDRSVLWNSVEMFEKRADAQYARTNRFPLPNDWSYETAVMVMRDYIQRNFVSKGMCCEWAIHDSENPKTGQRNLHCHIMLTMRPILEDGTWGARQKKIYKYDEQGNKVKKKNGRYDCTTVDVMGWSDKKNAMMWRQDFADTVNAVNEKLKIDEHWDHRSYKERGLDIEPTVHLGPKAAALERKGIRTERGDINREVKKHNAMIASLKRVMKSLETEISNIRIEAAKAVQGVKDTVTEKASKVKETAVEKTGEVIDFIRSVKARGLRMRLPVERGQYVPKVSNREQLQDPEFLERYARSYGIDSFADLQKFYEEALLTYERKGGELDSVEERLELLEKLIEIYNEYKPHKDVVDQVKGKNFAVRAGHKVLYKEDYDEADRLRKDMKDLLDKGEKIDGKKWKSEKKTLKKGIPGLKKEIGAEVPKLAFWEVIDFSRQFYDKSIKPTSMEARLYRQKERSDEMNRQHTEQRTQQQVFQRKRSDEPEL